MGADDPYQAQWDLRPRVAALRAETTEIRKHVFDEYQRELTALGTDRDRIAREKFAHEQSAKAADEQVTRETRRAKESDADADRYESQAKAAEAGGNGARAEELRELARGNRASQEIHEARAREATLQGAAARERAGTEGRRLTEAEVRVDDAATRYSKAEVQIDRLEQQTRLYEEARQKYAEASMAGDNVPRRAEAELAAEKLMAQAEAIVVDRAVIRTVIPDFPETTPGIDDPPGPLPEGATTSEDDDLSMQLPSTDGSLDGAASIDGTNDVVGDAAADGATEGDVGQPAGDDDLSRLVTLDEPHYEDASAYTDGFTEAQLEALTSDGAYDPGQPQVLVGQDDEWGINAAGDTDTAAADSFEESSFADSSFDDGSGDSFASSDTLEA